MGAKEKIKVFAIENSRTALNVLTQIFNNNELYEFKGKKVSGNDSRELEKSRSEQKKYIIDALSKEQFDILILDLLLRDTMDTDREKIEGEEFNGIEMILSLEIARQLKNTPGRQKFLPVFISSSEICGSHSKFQAMKAKHRDYVPDEAVFIFKPVRGFEKSKYINCPVYSSSKNPVCKKEQREPGGCSKKTCFLELLTKYYEEYIENDK